MIIFILAGLALTAPQSADPGPEKSRLVLVDTSRSSAEDLLRAGFDVVTTGGENGEVEIIASDRDLRILRRRNIRHRVLIDDLVAYYQSRAGDLPEGPPPLGAWLSPQFGSGSMGGFYTNAEVESVLDQMTSAYPMIAATKTSIGLSLQGREQWMVKISDNPGVDEAEPEVRMDAMHHCREPEAMQATLWFMLFLLEGYGTDPLATYLVNNREIYFIPVVNPDGYVYNQSIAPSGGGLWRKNRRNNGDGTFGVDLNRNYPYQWGFDDLGSSPSTSSETYRGTVPMSEPEVVNMVAFINSRDFRMALSTHTYSNLWLHPWGYTELAPPTIVIYDEITALATEVNGYTAGVASIVLYAANGVTIDTDQDLGTFSWTPEIGGSSDGFWPPPSRIVPLAEENLLAFQRTALAAGAFARAPDVTLIDAGDGDGFFEPGEDVEVVVTVRNSGIATTGTSVVGDLQTSSLHATVVGPAYDYGAVGVLTSVDNSASPMVISINAGAPVGSSIEFDCLLAYEGYTQILSQTLFLGEPKAIIRDELGVDYGWIAGAAGDGASTGAWELDDPIGTTSSGAPANPSDDNTGNGPCFMTGNGGINGGFDDLDLGPTTLVSPRFDLSSVGPATISYARWFADLSNADDSLEVSISNDDGMSWVPLESVVGNQNLWTTVSFEVPGFVAQTDRMRLRFITDDSPNNSVLEAAVDSLTVTIFDGDPKLTVYGEASPGSTVLFNVTGDPGASFYLIHPQPLILPAPVFGPGNSVTGGVIPAEGVARFELTIPNLPQLAGLEVYYRAVVLSGGSLEWTNVALVDIQ